MRPRTLLFACLLALPLTSRSHSAVAQTAPDETALLEVIDRFFLALHSGDADAMASLIRPDGEVVVVGSEGSDPQVLVRDLADTVARMRGEDWVGFRESYWSPTVLQRGRLAMVWAPYLLVVNDGRFSHCGVDQFTLTRTDAWRIEFAAFTVEPTRAACEALGQPQEATGMRPDFPD